MVHLNLVGPLRSSHGFAYCLTMMDRFLYFPEAVPLSDMSAETVAKAFYYQWRARTNRY